MSRRTLFFLFLVSGFCGLVYQLIWTRLAFAFFGITTPVLSVVVSVFMLGLALGSWAGGRWIERVSHKTGRSGLFFYGLAELMVGLGAFAVPALMRFGNRLLLDSGEMSSARYLFSSGVVLGLSILPWCILMGTTFPLMLAYLKERGEQADGSFSFLYVPNVIGAMAGTLLSALVLVELFGFAKTLWIAAGGNFLIALIALYGSKSAVRHFARATPSLDEKAQKEEKNNQPGEPNQGPLSPALSPSEGEREKTPASASLRSVVPLGSVGETTEQASSHSAISLSLSPSEGERAGERGPLIASGAGETRKVSKAHSRLILWILFWTGFASLAMEVVWIRSFAPVVKTQVYSFALVLATYLGATFSGSLCFRHHARRNAVRPTGLLLLLLCVAVFLPILFNDVRLVHPYDDGGMEPRSVAIVLSSIIPFCALLGYLTPRLVDDYSRGSPRSAGRAYAINVLGCILGPLVASYGLLPRMAERHALLLLALPFFGLYLTCRGRTPGLPRRGVELAAVAALVISLFGSKNFEGALRQSQKRFEVRRDYTASVICYGEGKGQRLLVNGIGMSAITPITKFMAHLPLALHKEPPKSALIICFGMGTSFRSALSWDIPTTSVELVPSVRDSFPFYHADARECLANPKGRIIIDDGRRFLMRTREKFDLIVIDPPPPVEAAGTSLLYSTEFYELAKEHLNSGGILQTWVPLSRGPTVEAAARSLSESFSYVRCFVSIERWGRHFLASQQPIEIPSAAELTGRLPPKASRDLMEWSTAPNVQDYLQTMLAKELRLERVLNPEKKIRITDARPYNEYFLLREKK